MNKVFVLGIDGAPPQMVFEKWIEYLPNIKKLMKQGAWGRIESTIPASTCVAWPSFFSGCNPGQHGIYCYNTRNGFSYTPGRLINANDLKVDMIWHKLAKLGKKSFVFNVPITYPIEKEISGCHIISDFLTPELNEKSVSPKGYYEGVKTKFPDYMFDVSVGLSSHRNEKDNELIKKAYRMTTQNFELIFDALKEKDWDFIGAVLLGSDRLEHRFWGYVDASHRYYKGETPYKNVLKDYFIFLDQNIGKIISLLPKDTTIIIASDHGMDKMNCRFNVNEWLIKEKYMVLKQYPSAPTKLDAHNVDWKKTKVFSCDAFFARIYFNLEGREPEGIVPLEDYTSLQKEIVSKLKEIKDDKGNDMDNRFYFPQDIYYGEYAEEAPDIIAYFDNLLCGVNSGVGYASLYSWATAGGSDDAGHAPEGIFIISQNGKKGIGHLPKIRMLDVAPTILDCMSMPLPKEMQGSVIKWSK